MKGWKVILGIYLVVDFLIVCTFIWMKATGRA